MWGILGRLALPLSDYHSRELVGVWRSRINVLHRPCRSPGLGYGDSGKRGNFAASFFVFIVLRLLQLFVSAYYLDLSD